MRRDTRGAKITKVEIKRNNNISKKRYPCGAVLWVEPCASWCIPCEVHGDDKEYLGCDV